MPFYGLSRRVHGVNNTLTACIVLSIYVRMSQRIAQFFANTVDFHKVYTAIMCVAVGNPISLPTTPDLFFYCVVIPAGSTATNIAHA